jgi:tetratricopeptide (TPR) repeat protein
MITSSQAMKHHDELVIDHDLLCTQIEAGNPFFSDQDLVLSKKGKPKNESLAFCSAQDVTPVNSNTTRFFEGSLGYALRRAERLPNSPDVLNTVALEYIRMGEVKKAVDQLNKILATHKEFFPALANLAKCYFMEGRLDESLDIYIRLKEKRHSDPRILTNMAHIYTRTKEFDKALSCLEEALKLEPMNHITLSNIGLLHLAMGNADRALSAIRKASSIRNDDSLIYNNLGVCFAVRKNMKKALINFRIAYSLNRNERRIISNLANALLSFERHYEVIGLLGPYLKDHSEESEFRNFLAWSLFKTRQYEECFSELKRGLENTASDDRKRIASFLNNIGVVYCHLGSAKEGEKFLLKSLETFSNAHLNVFLNLIDIYFKSEQYDKVKIQIDDALNVYRNHPILISCLGDYYRCTEKFQTAMEFYNKALAIDPSLLPPYLDMSVIEMDVNDDYASALEILSKGLSIHPTNTLLINNYAYCLLLLDRVADARKMLDKYDDESNPCLKATRGLLLIKEGSVDEGRRWYNQAIEMAGKDVKLAALIEQKKYLELGRYYMGHGKGREAIRLLKKGLASKASDNRYKNRILKLLENAGS